jgi:hypothetical protein
VGATLSEQRQRANTTTRRKTRGSVTPLEHQSQPPPVDRENTKTASHSGNASSFSPITTVSETRIVRFHHALEAPVLSSAANSTIPPVPVPCPLIAVGLRPRHRIQSDVLFSYCIARTAQSHVLSSLLLALRLSCWLPFQYRHGGSLAASGISHQHAGTTGTGVRPESHCPAI